jgi:hypothetical protein
MHCSTIPHFSRLDVIGLATLSHDFGSLSGKTSPLVEALLALAQFKPPRTNMVVGMLSQAFPAILKLPFPRARLMQNLVDVMDDIGDELLKKAARDRDSVATNSEERKSALELLRTCRLSPSIIAAQTDWWFIIVTDQIQ